MRKVCLEPTQSLTLLLQLFLLGDVDCGSNEFLGRPSVSDRVADATYETNLAIRSHNPFREVEGAMIYQHLPNRLDDGLPIVRVYEAQVLLCARGVSARVETVNLKQLGRPVLESSGAECPTTGVTQPLPFREIRFNASSGFLGLLELGQVKDKGHDLARCFLDRGGGNEDRHPAADFPQVLLFMTALQSGGVNSVQRSRPEIRSSRL